MMSAVTSGALTTNTLDVDAKCRVDRCLYSPAREGWTCTKLPTCARSAVSTMSGACIQTLMQQRGLTDLHKHYHANMIAF